ncbi:hypothetical protein LCGC14_2194560, partial [marine sediment metagenome]
KMEEFKSKVVSDTKFILLIHLNLDELRKIVNGVKNNKNTINLALILFFFFTIFHSNYLFKASIFYV